LFPHERAEIEYVRIDVVPAVPEIYFGPHVPNELDKPSFVSNCIQSIDKHSVGLSAVRNAVPEKPDRIVDGLTLSIEGRLHGVGHVVLKPLRPSLNTSLVCRCASGDAGNEVLQERAPIERGFQFFIGNNVDFTQPLCCGEGQNRRCIQKLAL
jgi:hypothetical protein